jgi:hypothetical protein
LSQRSRLNQRYELLAFFATSTFLLTALFAATLFASLLRFSLCWLLRHLAPLLAALLRRLLHRGHG